jgi:hypothetical protein
MDGEHDEMGPPTSASYDAEELAAIGSQDVAARYYEQVILGLSQMLLPMLPNDGVCLVRRAGDEFEVEAYRTLRKDYPAFYGFLLTLNQQISSATGCTFGFVTLLLVIAGIAGLYEMVPNLGFHAIWAYPLVIISGFFLWIIGNGRAERGVFLSHVDDLERQMAHHGIGRYRLIEWMTGDEQLARVLQFLKDETRLEEVSRDR